MAWNTPNIHGHPARIFADTTMTSFTYFQQEIGDSGDYVFHPDVLKTICTSLPQELNVDSKLNFELNGSELSLRPLRRQDFRNGRYSNRFLGFLPVHISVRFIPFHLWSGYLDDIYKETKLERELTVDEFEGNWYWMQWWQRRFDGTLFLLSFHRDSSHQIWTISHQNSLYTYCLIFSCLFGCSDWYCWAIAHTYG